MAELPVTDWGADVLHAAILPAFVEVLRDLLRGARTGRGAWTEDEPAGRRLGFHGSVRRVLG